MAQLPSDDVRRLRTVAAALFAAPLVLLAGGLVMRALGASPGAVPFVGWAAVGTALVSPLLAGGVRAATAERFAGEKQTAEAATRAVILPFAILEGAASFCGIAFLLTPSYAPLLAAVVPLGAMLLWFPRG